MDILLKQRLVGAIVLISLAVIFLPMFLSEKGEFAEDEFQSNIPPEPVYEIKAPQVAVPLEVPDQTLQKPPLSEPIAQTFKSKGTANVDDKSSDTKAQTTKAPAISNEAMQKDVVSPSKAQVAVPKPTAPEPKPNPAEKAQEPSQPATVAKTDKTPLTSTKQAPPDDLTGWVVQVGSFKKQSNAVALRDKLRKQGMSSFVMQVDGAKGTLYRVRVGPELNRSSAEQLQVKIKKKTKLEGVVMRYP
ncbi:SPOR domain-containing protein [Kaarinaea lacus]